MKKLDAFCSLHAIEDKLKFSPSVIECFVASLGDAQVSRSAIQSHLSAIRNHCKVAGIDLEFDTPRLKLLIRGVDRCRRPLAVKETLYVSISKLKRLMNSAPLLADSTEAVRLKACFSLAFFGLLRASELCRTVAAPQHQLLRRHLKLVQSAVILTFDTYKGSCGQSVAIRIEVDAGVEVSPWHALYQYLRLYPMPADHPLFEISDQTLTTWLKRCCVKAGISPPVTLHSFRRGGATWYAGLGWSELQLKRQGRWSSDAYMRYIKE